MKTLKTFLFSITLLLFAFTTFAQVEGTYKPMLSTTTGLALDTVTNAATKEQVLRVPGSNNVITIVTTVTEISGTTAGSVKLFGSINGTNYAQIDANAFAPADQTAAQSYTWTVTPSKYTYYKVSYTGAGTMAAKLATGLLRR